MSSSQWRRGETTRESWNPPLIRAEPGALVMFHGRLAEVVSPGSWANPAILDVTDDGGVTHTYSTKSSTEIELLGKEGCVLDDVLKAAAQPISNKEKLFRLAEEWLAAPQVGDMFHMEGSAPFLEIVELGEGGTIWGAVGFLKRAEGRKRPVAGFSFQGARELRRYLALKGRPVYRAQAYSSMRPDFADHELLRSHTNSPLWTGVLPSEQIAQRNQDV